MQKPKFIAIEGCIGVGKTTLCQKLAEHFNGKTLLEEVDNHPFLDDFYADKETSAFKTQVYFLLSRYNQQKTLDQQDLFNEAVVSDYYMPKDKLFAEINLKGSELGLYQQLYGVLCEQIHTPDLIIHLRAPLEGILARIEKRGRQFEKQIDPNYLSQLASAYDTFFKNFDKCPVLQIETSRFNIPESEDDLNCIIDFVYKTHGSQKSMQLGMRKDKRQPGLF